MSADERVHAVVTGNPEVGLLACTQCGVLVWDIDAHYAHAHEPDARAQELRDWRMLARGSGRAGRAMSEFTDEEVRSAVAFVPVTSIGMRFSDAEAEKFDRWLAAHDAESWRCERQVQEMFGALAFVMLDADIGERARAIVEQFTSSDEVLRLRAGVVAEETEWEMDALIESPGAPPRIYRRRKAGPWVPVKQEGADQ